MDQDRSTPIEDSRRRGGRYRQIYGPGRRLGVAARHRADLRPGMEYPAAIETLLRQNKPDGFMCVSCAWAKPADHHTFEFCENGAKATLWELTTQALHAGVLRRAHASPNCAAGATTTSSKQGRLTHPLRYDAASDRYVPVRLGRGVRRRSASSCGSLDPKSAVFYASGRASLETSYLYALFARLYGHNNLPDSSNMCHETHLGGAEEGDRRRRSARWCSTISSNATRCSSSARIPAPTARASCIRCRRRAKRGVPDRHLQSGARARAGELRQSAEPDRDADRRARPAISSQYHQVKPGGDIAVLTGICKHVFALRRRGAGATARGCSTPISSRSTPTASRRSRPRCAARSLGRDRAGVRPRPRGDRERPRRSMSRPSASSASTAWG